MATSPREQLSLPKPDALERASQDEDALRHEYDPPIDAADWPRLASSAQLLNRIDSVKDELRQSQQNSTTLREHLADVMKSSATHQDSRRAALNIMEDAIQSRSEALALNTELLKRIEERERAEAALRESEARLKARSEELQRLHADLEQRVYERTCELQNREERLRDLALQLKRVEQRERQRLARILHDHVQQLLVAAKMQIGVVASDLPVPKSEILEGVMGTLDDAINAARDLSVQLTPPLLHDLGLPAALVWLVTRIKELHGLRIKAQIDHRANPATEEEREIIFQAAQELLLNVIKHAKIKSATLELARDADGIRVEISDRGAGFEVPQVGHARGSFGLFQVQQRLRSVGGLMTIVSSPGKGTSVSAVIPFASSVVDPVARG